MMRHWTASIFISRRSRARRSRSSNRCAPRSRPSAGGCREGASLEADADEWTPRGWHRTEPQPFKPTRKHMSSVARYSAALIVATVAAPTAVLAQGLEVRRYNPSESTKGRLSEVVTVDAPAKPYPPALARKMSAVRREQATPSCIRVTPTSSADTRTTRSNACGRARSVLGRCGETGRLRHRRRFQADVAKSGARRMATGRSRPTPSGDGSLDFRACCSR